MVVERWSNGHQSWKDQKKWPKICCCIYHHSWVGKLKNKFFFAKDHVISLFQISIRAKNSWKRRFEEKSIDFTEFLEKDAKTQCGKPRYSLSSPKNISSNQLFSNLFSKTVTFTKFLLKMCEKREFPAVISTLCNSQCGKTRNSLSLKKCFVKSTL